MDYIEYKDNNGQKHKVPTFTQTININKNPSSNYDKFYIEFPEELEEQIITVGDAVDAVKKIMR